MRPPCIEATRNDVVEVTGTERRHRLSVNICHYDGLPTKSIQTSKDVNHK